MLAAVVGQCASLAHLYLYENKHRSSPGSPVTVFARLPHRLCPRSQFAHATRTLVRGGPTRPHRPRLVASYRVNSGTSPETRNEYMSAPSRAISEKTQERRSPWHTPASAEDELCKFVGPRGAVGRRRRPRAPGRSRTLRDTGNSTRHTPRSCCGRPSALTLAGLDTRTSKFRERGV